MRQLRSALTGRREGDGKAAHACGYLLWNSKQDAKRGKIPGLTCCPKFFAPEAGWAFCGESGETCQARAAITCKSIGLGMHTNRRRFGHAPGGIVQGSAAGEHR